MKNSVSDDVRPKSWVESVSETTRLVKWSYFSKQKLFGIKGLS